MNSSNSHDRRRSRAATQKWRLDRVKTIISEGACMAALDGKNPADVERWLFNKLRPFLKGER